jgi:hypothetical protein
LSGPKNIVLLLSRPYVANWVRRMSAEYVAEVTGHLDVWIFRISIGSARAIS